MEPHGQVILSLAQSLGTDMAALLIHCVCVLTRWFC